MQGSLARVMRDVKSERRINSKITDIYYILLIIILFTSSFLSGDENIWYSEFGEMSYVLSAFSYALHLPLAVIIIIYCAKLFRDVHSSTQADVIMSLPMSAAQRYFSKFASFIMLIVLPYIAMAILSIAGILIANSLVWDSMIPVKYIVISVLTRYYAGVVGIMFIGAVSFVCSSFSVNAIEAVITSAVSCTAATLLPIFCYSNLLLGSSYLTFAHKNYFVYDIWTFTPIVTCLEDLDEYYFRPDLDTIPLLLGMAVNIIISLLVTAIGVKIYKKRDKATLTYNRISLPFLFCIIMLLVIDIWLYNINTPTTAYIGYGFLIVGFAGFVLLLRRRGFKTLRLLKWGIGFVAAPVVFIGLCAIVYFTDGLYISKAPKYIDGSIQIYINIHTPCTTLPEWIEPDDEVFKEETEICVRDASREDYEKILSVMDGYTVNPKSFSTFLDFMGLYKNGSYDQDIMSASFLDDRYHIFCDGTEEYLIRTNVMKESALTPDGEEGKEGEIEYEPESSTSVYGFTKGIDEAKLIEAVKAINPRVSIYHMNFQYELVYHIDEDGVKEEFHYNDRDDEDEETVETDEQGETVQ